MSQTLSPKCGTMITSSLPNSDNDEDRLADTETAALIAAYLADSAGAADRLAELLIRRTRQTICAFLKSHEPETEDLVQETVLAVMNYLQHRGGFAGNLVSFANTVARNRCRNYLIWRKRHDNKSLEAYEPYLVSTADNPLDRVLDEEVTVMVQNTLANLDSSCRNLLRAIYLEGVTVDEIRRQENLKTVQSIYYRRAKCLAAAGQLLKKALLDCSEKQEAE